MRLQLLQYLDVYGILRDHYRNYGDMAGLEGNVRTAEERTNEHEQNSLNGLNRSCVIFAHIQKHVIEKVTHFPVCFPSATAQSLLLFLLLFFI